MGLLLFVWRDSSLPSAWRHPWLLIQALSLQCSGLQPPTAAPSPPDADSHWTLQGAPHLRMKALVSSVHTDPPLAAPSARQVATVAGLLSFYIFVLLYLVSYLSSRH